MKNIIIILIIALYATQSMAEKPIFDIKIERNMTCSDGSTMGRLLVNGKEFGRTLELPWKNNEQRISHIPVGSYDASIRSDGKRKWRIELKGVKNRDFIQIHLGNYQRQIKGCILVGESIEKGPNGECMVTKSILTLNKLSSKLETFADGGNMTKSVDIKVTVE